MSENDKKPLELTALYKRHSGLTRAISDTFYEAVSICLSRHHVSPVDMRIECDKRATKRTAEFATPTVRTLNAWANNIDTTESGAYGVCLAAIEVEEDMIAVRRAETLTGADWYVAPMGTRADDLERCLRLEVSGVDGGTQSTLKTRLRQKVEQTKRGVSNIPAIASVVGFKEKTIMIQTVERSDDMA
ncbi:MAG TPA: hypothetical protein VJR90_08835 [Gammaproteobacteria bacterium]|nr:hypothetical protein [Gammaproteobacteria bacterium]